MPDVIPIQCTACAEAGLLFDVTDILSMHIHFLITDHERLKRISAEIVRLNDDAILPDSFSGWQRIKGA